MVDINKTKQSLIIKDLDLTDCLWSSLSYQQMNWHSAVVPFFFIDSLEPMFSEGVLACKLWL